MNQPRFIPFFLLIPLVLCACQPVQKPLAPVVIDPAELGVFADAFFSDRMDALHIPGLVFIFVQGGEVVYSHGYGLADLEAGAPMDAESSVVRIGSISKPFVATAVMQLVERGLLDLHADINRYLSSFNLESSYSDPVTLAHLLTHTSGIEDPPYVSNTDPCQVQPLGKFLAANLPYPAHPPGEVFLYSNYGYALAALIVAEVSGTPFDEYVEENIFQPLRMHHSRYLLAPPLPETMVTGYLYQDGVQIPQPMDYDSDYPGGSIVSTIEDMSHFILAHLQDGCYLGACILLPATLGEMHQQQAETPFEGQNATYGFVEGISDGVRLLGHSGAIRGFGNSLNMFPEHDMGYFFSFNTECYETSACEIIQEFRHEFINRFFEYSCSSGRVRSQRTLLNLLYNPIYAGISTLTS